MLETLQLVAGHRYSRKRGWAGQRSLNASMMAILRYLTLLRAKSDTDVSKIFSPNVKINFGARIRVRLSQWRRLQSAAAFALTHSQTETTQTTKRDNKRLSVHLLLETS